jgi:hypothetical protein
MNHPLGHRPSGVVAAPQRHRQTGLDERDVLGGRGGPADDRPRVQVDREGHVGEPGPRRHIREVGDPGPVRRAGTELPIEQIPSAPRVLGGDGGAGLAATHQPAHPFLAHQPVYRVLRDTREAVAGQPGGHLAPAVKHLGQWPTLRPAGLEVPQRVDHRGVIDRPRRGRVRLPRPVGTRGDPQALLTQHPADRLDPAPSGALLVDEPNDQRWRGSVKSVRGAVPFLRPARFPGPLPEPGVHLSMHRALHKPRRVGRDRRIRRRTARGSG